MTRVFGESHRVCLYTVNVQQLQHGLENAWLPVLDAECVSEINFILPEARDRRREGTRGIREKAMSILVTNVNQGD